MTRMNLLPAELVARRCRARRIAMWAWVLCAGGAVAVAGGALVRVTSSGLGLDTSVKITAIRAQTEEERGATARLTAEAADLRRRAQVAAQVSRRPDWSILLGVLASERGGGVVLESVEVKPVPSGAVAPSGFAISVAGLAETMSDAQGYVLRLEGLGMFDEVRLVETVRTTARGREAVRFAVVFRLTGGVGEGGGA